MDPRQTFVGSSVALSRICKGVVLHPGARIEGPRTFVGPGAEVAHEGPATLRNAVLGAGAAVASGFVDGAVLLRGARVGANAHLRPGTLLEEEASTAHAVGLKQTLLLSFVTLGSVINFCDCLMAGGSSRQDHSEVGSGFIHFNFTPWGERGDKATPSLVGDVVRGVFLRAPRIFLGGAGGMVGPTKVGFGSVAAAGQVVRSDIDAGRLVMQKKREVDIPMRWDRLGGVDDRTKKNLRYIAELVALRVWYREVRLARIAPQETELRAVLVAALAVINLCIEERIRQLARFRDERDQPPLVFDWKTLPECPRSCRAALSAPGQGHAMDHVEWVQGLDGKTVKVLGTWLQAVVDQVCGDAT